MSMLRKTVGMIFATLLIAAMLCTSLAVSPKDYNMNAPENLVPEHLFAESAIVVDEDSGEVLFSKNSRVRMYPASTTKIMTLLLALESGIDLDSEVTIPREASLIPDGSSVIPVKPGDVCTFRDLLYGFMLSSGNDGANAIAVLVDRTLDDFVNHMNARAAELGCEGTHYVNAHGYHDADHYTTAQDLATISRFAMQNETFRAIVAAPTWEMTLTRGDKTGKATIVNRNSLLLQDDKYYYPDCTGIKTGHHRKAGWCFVGSAERDGKRVICVALNCEKEEQKWYDAARMFEYGFTRYESADVQALMESAKAGFDTVEIADAADDDPQNGVLKLNLDEAEVDGEPPMLPIGSDAAVILATEKLASTLEIEWERELTAPVSQGEKLGTLRGTLPGGGAVTASLTAERDVKVQPKATPVPTPAPTTEPLPPQEPSNGTVNHSTGSGLVTMLALIGALIAVLMLWAGLTLSQRRKRRRRARRRSAARRRK